MGDVDAVRSALLLHLRGRPAEDLGWGRDAYVDGEARHPMAMACYIRGLIRLAAATGDGAHLDAALRVAEVLVEMTRAGPDTAWGLGFSWDERPAEAPYTVTTALCVSALAELHEATGAPWLLTAVVDAAAWLTWRVPWTVERRGACPWYGMSTPYRLPNVAGLTVVALELAGRLSGDPRFLSAAAAAADFVAAVQHPSGCWRYGWAGVGQRGRLRPPDVVDAIHTGYVLQAAVAAAASPVLGRRSLGAAVVTGTRFVERQLMAPGGRLVEKVVIVDTTDELTLRLLRDETLVTIELENDQALVRFPVESRPFGYGSVLAALARAQLAGIASSTITAALAARLLTVHGRRADGRFAMSEADDRVFPRQEAHAFEGLAEYLLAAARTGARRRRDLPTQETRHLPDSPAEEVDQRLAALAEDLEAFPAGAPCPWPLARVFNELLRRAKLTDDADPVVRGIRFAKEASDAPATDSDLLVGTIRALISQVRLSVATSGVVADPPREALDEA